MWVVGETALLAGKGPGDDVAVTLRLRRTKGVQRRVVPLREMGTLDLETVRRSVRPISCGSD